VTQTDATMLDRRAARESLGLAVDIADQLTIMKKGLLTHLIDPFQNFRRSPRCDKSHTSATPVKQKKPRQDGGAVTGRSIQYLIDGACLYLLGPLTTRRAARTTGSTSLRNTPSNSLLLKLSREINPIPSRRALSSAKIPPNYTAPEKQPKPPRL